MYVAQAREPPTDLNLANKKSHFKYLPFSKRQAQLRIP